MSKCTTKLQSVTKFNFGLFIPGQHYLTWRFQAIELRGREKVEYLFANQIFLGVMFIKIEEDSVIFVTDCILRSKNHINAINATS